MKKLLTKGCLCLVVLAVICSMALPCLAYGKDRTTLKVGFYPMKGFFAYDAQGNESGYGVEVLNEIEKYTNFHFEYVPMATWEGNFPALQRGKIDLIMPVSRPSSDRTQYSWTDQTIIDTYHCIFTLKSREDLHYQDFKSISKLKIAVFHTFQDHPQWKEYVEKVHLDPANFVYCDSFSDSWKAVQAGKADAVFSNVMDFDGGTMKMLDRFYTESNVIVSLHESAYIHELNEAITQIKLNVPTFFPELSKVYFPERTIAPLSMAEEQALAQIDTLCFSFTENRGYLNDTVNGELVGILPTIARLVCDKLGVEFAATNAAHLSGASIDGKTLHCDAAFVHDHTSAEDADVGITDGILYVQYNQVYRKDRPNIDPKTCSVALAKNMICKKGIWQALYRPEQMIWYDTPEDCIRAVADGRTDIALINNYISNYYLSMYRYNNLTQRILDDSHIISFAVPENHELILSAMNKALRSLTDQELSTIIIQETSRIPEQRLMEELLYGNPAGFIAVCTISLAVLLILLFLCVILNILRRKNRQLALATEARSNFFSRMSHDMRTPMNAVLSFSKMAREESTDTQINAYLDDIHSTGEYLLSLINDVLDIQKMEQQELVLHPQSADLDQLFRDVFNMVQPMMAQKNLSFSFSNDANGFVMPRSTSIDVLRTKQIFINLLTNAVKFTPEHGKISLRAKVLDYRAGTASIEFSVSDTGVGMSPEFQTHMFDAYTQENRADTNIQQGTGLGLPIVKHIVDTMNGTITCRSQEGVGTTITVTLPLLLTEPGSAAAHAIATSGSLLTGKRILLCEDHPMNIKIAQKLLEKKGMLVVTAQNGQIGLETFRDSAVGFYDAILMDIRMPDMDGLTAAAAIRALDRADAQTVPIIALTANAFAEDVAHSKLAGMDAHLAKPIDPALLEQTLCDLICQQDTSLADCGKPL